MLSAELRAYAREIGFHLVGITSPEPFERAELDLLNWLQEGHQGEMAWMSEARARLSCRPQELLPSARSLVVVGVSYRTEEPTQHSALSTQHSRRGRVAGRSLNQDPMWARDPSWSSSSSWTNRPMAHGFADPRSSAPSGGVWPGMRRLPWAMQPILRPFPHCAAPRPRIPSRWCVKRLPGLFDRLRTRARLLPGNDR